MEIIKYPSNHRDLCKRRHIMSDDHSESKSESKKFSAQNVQPANDISRKFENASPSKEKAKL